ncbi:MFS transporter [Nonomuraea diastatica]|uniref:MFS transporter n=1 Tax=Nonomuraea diastatica TaxID=1848329 RepID=A0A4R4W7Z3_9ACTN|nr:MFS transporter [Nonomuraea diastatica]TDD14802.1 MFS transporter [Nonomuraea diastatica]
MASLRMFEPLRRTQYRRIFAGQLVSGLGDWLDTIALLTLVAYVWESGAFALAGLTMAQAVPWIAVAPFVGVWVDRLPPRSVMITANLVRAAFVLGYLLAPNLPVLLLLVMGKSVLGTFFEPAERKAIRLSSPPDELHAATSLTTLSGQATKVAGPAIGGLLVAAAGPYWAFVANAASFVISAVVLAGLHLPQRAAAHPAPVRGRFWSEFNEGLGFVVRNPRLRVALLGMTATIFLVFTFDTLSPLTVTALGLDSSVLGFAIAGIGAGAVFGTILIGQWGERMSAPVLMSVSQAAAGGLIAVIGLVAWTETALPGSALLAMMIITGVAAAGILMSFALTLQTSTPEVLLGRVSGAADVLPTVMMLVAPPIGAALAAGLGVGGVLALAGAALALLGVATFLPAQRAADRPTPLFAEPDLVAHATFAAPDPLQVNISRHGRAPSVLF